MLIYDFPDAYDLFYTKAFREDSQKFFSTILKGKRIRDILDCSVGTGQIGIPLMKLGYNFTGSDVNPNMIKKARQNFAKEELMPNLVKADYRELYTKIKRTYDAVFCTGNSLGCIPNNEIELVLSQMDKIIKPGGLLYFDSRNWDRILENQQRFYLFNPIIRAKGRINYLQVWDYNKDSSMTINYLYSEEIDNKIVSKRQFYELFYPFKFSLIQEFLEKNNYQNIQIFKLGDASVTDINLTSWYCVLAEKCIPELTKKNKK